MSISMKVAGLEKCLHNLAELPKRTETKLMRIALSAGGGIVKQTVISLAPSKHLKKHQIVKVKRKRSGEWFAAIGTKRGKTVILKNKGKIGRTTRTQTKKFNISRIAHLLEGGTKKHEVRAKSKRTLAAPVGGVWQAFGRRVMVGSKATNYMRRAAAISGPAAQAKTVSKLNEGITKEAVSLLK
jgi:hypothetical protein